MILDNDVFKIHKLAFTSNTEYIQIIYLTLNKLFR